VDVNAAFLQRARAVSADGGVDAFCSFHHMLDEVLPLDDETVERALAKNVLEYVPDLATTLAELHRVLRPGGRLLAIDSDWGFMVAEPLSADELREVLTAASPAFREPHIGRKLRGAFIAAGYTDVHVNVMAFADVNGLLRGVLDNMVRYGIQFQRLSDTRAREVADRLDAGQRDGSFLVVLPQFFVTGTKPR
jgi:SAM-dependent methyltransferase